MANSDLYGTYFKINPIPLKRVLDNVIIKYGDKAETAKFIVGDSNGEKEPYSLTYSLAKKIKHFFDNYNSSKDDSMKYELYGGDKMKNYINLQLSSKRNNIKTSKRIKKDIAGFDNQFIKTHEKSFLKPTDISKLKIDTKMDRIELNEWHLKETETNTENILQPTSLENTIEPKFASIALIINPNKEILLVKRSELTDWESGKWALVGGKQEDYEDSFQCVLREIFEETNLLIDGLIGCGIKEENGFNVSNFFAICKTPDSIKLSPEHSEYKWVKPKDLTDLEKDCVPNLISDINIILNFVYSRNVIKNTI